MRAEEKRREKAVAGRKKKEEKKGKAGGRCEKKKDRLAEEKERERGSKLTATWLFSTRLALPPLSASFFALRFASERAAFIQRQNTEKTEEES